MANGYINLSNLYKRIPVLTDSNGDHLIAVSDLRTAIALAEAETGEVERAFGFFKGNDGVDVANALSYAARLLFAKMGGQIPVRVPAKGNNVNRPTSERR